MTTYKEIAQVIKQAADKIVELQSYVSGIEKESKVNEILSNMKEKGLIDDKAAGEKKKELLKSDESEIAIHKKAVELFNGRPESIAVPSTKSASASAEAQFDSWVMGG